MTNLELIKSEIERAYTKALKKDKELLKLAQKIKDGKANYDDLLKFSQAVSKIQTKAFFDHMNLDQLTEEEANFLFLPTIEDGYDQIAQAAYDIQQHLNELADLGLEPQIAPIDQEMLDGLMQKVSEGPWEETKKYLDDQLECFFQKSVDRHAEANAKLHYKVGMSPKITRKAAPGCCEWCVKQAGTYLYDPGMSRNVFRRHTRCRCSVLYDPVDGSKRLQDAHSKEWIDEKTRDQYLEWQVSKSGMDFGAWIESKKSDSKVTEETIKKLEGVMSEQNRKDLLERINNAPDYMKRSYGYMDQLSGVEETKDQAYYRPAFNKIFYNLNPEWEEKDKFTTFGHEFGHFVDEKGKFSGITYEEHETYSAVSDAFRISVHRVASASDRFIQAVRKDRDHLVDLEQAMRDGYGFGSSKLINELVKADGTRAVQDILSACGFGRFDGLIATHEQSYWGDKYATIKACKQHKALKEAMVSRGMNVKKLSDVAWETRIWATASETWAHISAASITTDNQLDVLKKYMPNSVEAFEEIMKGLEDANENEL